MIEKILTYLNNNQDKVIHFCGGYILSTFLPVYPLIGLLIAILAGILKEIYDSKNKSTHTVDSLDAIATTFGGGAGFIALYLKQQVL